MKKKNPSIFQKVDPSIIKIDSDNDLCCFDLQKIKKNGLLSQITLRIASEFIYYIKVLEIKISFFN